MQTLLLLTLLFVARLASGDNTCAVYDEQGNKLGSGPHFMGTLPGDIKPGNVLPGRLRLESTRAVTLKSGTCNPDFFQPELTSDWLRFEVTEKFRPEGMSGDGCVFVLQMERSEECPDAAGTEFTIEYAAGEGMRAPIFEKENYTFQMSFPVSKGTVINKEDIVVTTRNASTISLELRDPFDGIEIVRLDSSTDQTHKFQLKTNKLLYMLEHLRSVLVAKADHGGVNSTVPFILRMSEDSAVPKAEFEKSFYDVTIQASHLNPSTNVFPAGTIKLGERYHNPKLDIRTLNDPDDLCFEVSNEEDARVVDVRLTESPKTNLTSRDIFLQVTARLTNVFGRESEASAFLLVRVIGNPGCASSDLVENKEQMAMIILSIIVAILLLAIIYLYYKYVRGRKSPEAEKAVEKAPPLRAAKNRRPTPRVISEYPYPLEKLPKPLETLAETEEDGIPSQGKFVEIKIVDDAKPKPKISTRKRSVTFLESDAESRQIRESLEEAPAERKVSGESQRRGSTDEDERRRRKSSVKMYRCLT